MPICSGLRSRACNLAWLDDTIRSQKNPSNVWSFFFRCARSLDVVFLASRVRFYAMEISLGARIDLVDCMAHGQGQSR